MLKEMITAKSLPNALIITIVKNGRKLGLLNTKYKKLPLLDKWVIVFGNFLCYYFSKYAGRLVFLVKMPTDEGTIKCQK